MTDFKKLFASFPSLKVGVIGDVMLDTYLWGKVDRISPEAPVPVVTVQGKDFRIGGAGNVALNARSLGATVAVLSVSGKDDEAVTLKSLFSRQDIDTSYLVQSTGRITTSKTRIISRNQQMMRLDSEITADLDKTEEELLLDNVKAYISREKPSVIILEDYNKGVLTERVITEVIRLSGEAGIVTAVDPKRMNFFSKEVKEGLNLLFDEVDQTLLNTIHRELANRLQHRISFITLSEKGVFFQTENELSLIPSHLRNIADVSGAGDTVIAVAAMTYAITKNIRLMAEVANIAGGLVCEEVGTVAINKEKLLQECELLLS